MMKLIVKAQVSDKESKDFSYEFDQPVVTLGRLKENDIQLPLSTVSGFHAQILQEGDNYYLLDRGSINGTYLNSQRIPSGEKKLLHDGDFIRIQTFEIYFSSGAMMHIDQGATVQVARQMVMEVLGSWEAQSKEKPRLITMGGPDNGKQIELVEGKTVAIGRATNCDVVIEHPSISRKHAEVSFSWSGAFLKDLDSANGVFCNDQRISGSQKLHDRDEIRLGQQASPNPIRLIFSNPAEALLSKIEEAQITDSNRGVAEEKKVTDGKEQPAEKVQAPVATVAPPPPPSDGAAAASVEAPVPSAPATSMPSTAAPASVMPKRKWLNPIVIAAAALLLVTIAGGVFLYLRSGHATPVFGEVNPPEAATGEVITISGTNLDAASINGAILLERNVPILGIEDEAIRLKIPAFPQMEPSERQTEILLQNEKGTAARIPFTLVVAPELKSVDPLSGKAGTEVHVHFSGGSSQPSVYFGATEATVSSVNGEEIVCQVPNLPQVTAAGLKVPVSVRMNQIASRRNLMFTVFPEPTLQALNPQTGAPGTEVNIQANVDLTNPVVYFGSTQATLKSAKEREIVAVVPTPPEMIPPSGLKTPVSIKIGDAELKNKIDFTIIPGQEKPPEVFTLAFSAKPYSQSLGFNEYAVESNIGPMLVLVGKDVYGSSNARAEAVAKSLNETVDYYKNNSSAKIRLIKDENNALYAESDSSAERKLLLHVFPEDALAYGKINQRVISVDDLAEWWQMLLDSYFKVFVQVKSPAETGILSSGGSVLQSIVNFFSVADQTGAKYYKKDFLNNVPEDQKTRLLALSLSPPPRLTSIDGKWVGTIKNILYSNISEPNLELILNLHQHEDGTVSGKADLNWKVAMGGNEGEFQNVAYKKLGTYDVTGSYQKSKAYPLEFSFTDREQGRLNFVGRLEGNSLRGNFVISATGEDGTWSAKPK